MQLRHCRDVLHDCLSPSSTYKLVPASLTFLFLASPWLVNGRPGLRERRVMISNASLAGSYLSKSLAHWPLHSTQHFLTTPPATGSPLKRTVWFELFGEISLHFLETSYNMDHTSRQS